MKKQNRILKAVFSVMLVLCCASLALADGEKQRMLERVPQIKAHKDAGIVGETADGLLGIVKAGSADKALIDAENKDRQAVYAAIAQSQGTQAARVAELRAKQIAGQADAGHWLQDADGKWYQK